MERSCIDVLLQSSFMQLGSQGTYNSLTDKRYGSLSTNDTGLTEFEKTFTEIHDKTNANLTQLHGTVEEAKSEWNYIVRAVSTGIYPLLMRICSSYCVGMQEFLDTNITRLMAFLKL